MENDLELEKGAKPALIAGIVVVLEVPQLQVHSQLPFASFQSASDWVGVKMDGCMNILDRQTDSVWIDIEAGYGIICLELLRCLPLL